MTEISAGEAILRSLKNNGIDFVFMNSGSDFAPIIEALASADASTIPEIVTAPHENVAVAMAHGYYLATGRMQAAAVHVNVGLANAVMGLLNAASDDVPIFMLSGRNPLTEGTRLGSRSTPIQYGQEMFDQTALVREAVKWDYELRYGENAADLVSRACAIARSEPTAPVYLSLPREPLAEMTKVPPVQPSQVHSASGSPDPDLIAETAALLSAAKNPLIICSRGDPQGVLGQELAAMAEENAFPIAEVFVTRNVMKSSHPNAVGGALGQLLPKADVVLVVDTSVAWIEKKAAPSPDATVIHLGPDPLFQRMPVRGYRTTHAVQCSATKGVRALRKALSGKSDSTRQAKITTQAASFADRNAAKAFDGSTGEANKAWVARCVSAILGDGTVVAERGGPRPLYELTRANQWFGNAQSGGLGWALPAALGVQLADRERLTVCVTGDGSYMFANPIAAHQVAAAQGLAVLTIVLNNGAWDAVRNSTVEMYPNGAAARANVVPTVPFLPTPDFAGVAEACGAYVERVLEAADLPAALDRAVEIIRRERRQVLLDVKLGPDDGEK